MNEQWLKCQLLKGMFSDEVAIKYSCEGGQISVFVPKETVFGDIDHEGRVKVMVFEQGGNSWAVLPTAQKAIIPIDIHDLVNA